MAFFVLDKDVTTGSLRLPIDGTFGTREEALGALSAAAAAGEATVTGAVFVVDLDTAVPVLVMSTPVAAPARQTEEAPAEAPPAPEDELPVEEVAEPEPEPEPLPEPGAQADGIEAFSAALAGGSLADALKRAATSLEDEGIIAPDSISADDFSFEDDVAVAGALEGAPETTVWAEEPGETPAAAEPADTHADESPEVLEAPADWPWTNVEALPEELLVEPEPEEAATESVEAPHDDVSVTEDAPVAVSFDDTETLITSAPPLGEDAYVPRPVILGDYADAAPEVAAPVPPAEPPVAEPPAVEMAYEPTGELDLASYSCNDCVYSNTCPKVGEVTPADCGTFQWRSS